MAKKRLSKKKSVEKTLQENEKLLITILQTLPLAVFAKNIKNNFQFSIWNREAELLFGIKAEDIIGKWDEDIFPKEQADFFRAKDIEASRTVGIIDIPEETAQTAKGPVILRSRKTVIRDSDGEPSILVGITEDITSRKEAELALGNHDRALLAEAEKANRIKDEFLSTLSHELRTPLAPILSWAQLLRSGRLDAEKTTQAYIAIEKCAKVQGQLIDDLLDISRIQAGKLKLEVQKIDPRKVITAALESTRSLAAAKEIEIETKIEPSIKTIFADPSRLQQVFWNLITNSIKFSPQNSKVRITLDYDLSAAEGRIRIQVQDEGKGIASEFMPTIFERFTQVDSTSTRAYGGLGLGLSIVRKLVEMHGGEVSAESAGEGMGATFTVFLPATPASGVNLVEVEDEAQSSTELKLDGLRVLLVDDEASAREVYSYMIQSLGAEVKTAESANKALALLGEFKPDVLVSDIAMPGDDGYFLITKIRALKSKLGLTPALALTAYAGPEDIRRAHHSGFQSHLAKPVDAHKLAYAISRLAGRS